MFGPFAKTNLSPRIDVALWHIASPQPIFSLVTSFDRSTILGEAAPDQVDLKTVHRTPRLGTLYSDKFRGRVSFLEWLLTRLRKFLGVLGFTERIFARWIPSTPKAERY